MPEWQRFLKSQMVLAMLVGQALNDPNKYGVNVIRILRRSSQYFFGVPVVSQLSEVKSQKNLIHSCAEYAEKWEKGGVPIDAIDGLYEASGKRIVLNHPLGILAKGPLSFARSFTPGWRQRQAGGEERHMEMLYIAVLEGIKAATLIAPKYLAEMDPERKIVHFTTFVDFVLEEKIEG